MFNLLYNIACEIYMRLIVMICQIIKRVVCYQKTILVSFRHELSNFI